MSKLHRGGSATDVPVRALAIARVDGVDTDVDPDHAFAVTAAVTASGLLRIVLWRVALDGSTVHAQASVDDRAVSAVAVATENAHSITAVIDDEGHLRVDSWGLDLTARGGARGAKGSRPVIAKARPSTYVTAMRDSEGRLRVDVWLVPFDGTVSHHSQAVGSAQIEEVKLIGDTLGSFPGDPVHMQVLVRLASGEMEIQRWVLSPEPESAPSREGAPFKAGKVKRIACASSQFGNVFTAVESGGSNLEIFNADKLRATAGAISRVATCRAINGYNHVIMTTAVRTDGNLKLIDWRVAPDNTVTRDDDLLAGAVKDLDVTSIVTGEQNTIATAVRLENDELRVTAWRVAPRPTEFFQIAFKELHCSETTDDQGSAHDEPYAVFVTLDTAAPASAKVARTKVFRGVDESAADATRKTWVAVFGDDTSAARLTDPDHLIILVGLMESDDSSADKVMKKAFEAARDLAVTLVDAGKTRAEMVSQLLAAFRKGLLQGASVSGLFDSDDDLIGRVQELRIRQTDLDEANAKGTAVKRVLSFGDNEDAGKYELHFELTSEGI